MAETVFESGRELEVRRRADVLVAGGGIAGIAAALSAARAGADVTLVEREYALGGMATLGLVTIYLPLDDGVGNQVVFGIGEELLRLSIKHGCEALYPGPWLQGGPLEERLKSRYMAQFNPHLFCLEVERMLVAEGVRILYGTLIADVVMDGGSIAGVVVENKSGRSAIACRTVVDCTGDADVAKLAGAEMALHEGGNGLASWYYHLDGGVPRLKMFGLADVAQDREERDPADDPFDNAKTTSLAPTRFSGVDGDELSAVVIEAHAKMLADALATMEGDPENVPTAISSIPLVRMSRRIVGTCTVDEADDHRPFAESIGMTGDWRKAGPCFEIPYGTLCSANVPNLLAAGRDISTTDPMWDITRVIPPCAVTGEAAGLAAALAVKEGTGDLRTLDVARLQGCLAARGIPLHWSDIALK